MLRLSPWWAHYQCTPTSWRLLQELSSILEQVPKHGAEPAAAGEALAEGAAAENGLQAEAAETEQSEDAPVQKFKKKFIQTFVFSATLTLPSSLRERLRKGTPNSSAGGHSS